MEPFAGAVRDGHVWGRGTVDMKGMGVMELLVLLLHRRLGLPLGRDLVLMAVADEEAGGLRGIEFLDSAHPELLDCAYVINEGGMGARETFGVKRPIFTIGVSEKGPLWLTLRTTGQAGHGSVPHGDAAVERLVRRARADRGVAPPARLVPEGHLPPGGLHRAGVLRGCAVGEDSLPELAAARPRLRSLERASIALTGHGGREGTRHPVAAEATLDVRLLPSTTPGVSRGARGRDRRPRGRARRFSLMTRYSSVIMPDLPMTPHCLRNELQVLSNMKCICGSALNAAVYPYPLIKSEW